MPLSAKKRLQFGHGSTAVEHLAEGEAADLVGGASIRPRQHCRGAPQLELRTPLAAQASIRPRQHCRGAPPAGRPTARRWCGFNSATAALPWSTVALTGIGDTNFQLQFGHGSTAVE